MITAAICCTPTIRSTRCRCRCADDFENDPPFGSQHPGGAQFVFCDGHVTFLTDTIDMGIYRALSTRATGETIPADQIQ